MKAVKKKVYDKTAKGYITDITTNAASSMSIPKTDKGLEILMPYVLFQVYIPYKKQISIEFVVTDSKLHKKRINFGRGTKTVTKSLHHSRLPSCGFKQGSWVNLCIDVKSFFEYCYPESTFKQIDGITLQSFCLCRKIFALRSPVIDTSDIDIHSIEIPEIDEYIGEELPKHL